MVKNNKGQVKKLPVILAVVIVIMAGFLLTAGGFAFAAVQESNDAFCGSCHSQPESTYVQRSVSTQSVDLASYHTTQKTLCIDCHSGQGLNGRLQAELMGAKNALKWFSGTAVQPAVLEIPVRDENCLKCHQNVKQKGFVPKEKITVPTVTNGRRTESGKSNHWHENLARWQAKAANAGTCNSCHFGHSTDVAAQNGFLNTAKVQATCRACHQVLGD